MVYSEPISHLSGNQYQQILNNCYQQTAEIATNGWNFLAEEDEFILDLSKCSLIECMQAYADNKGKIHPSVNVSVHFCVHHLKQLQEELHVTLKPSQITSIFYNRFISSLTEKGLAMSSIDTLCSCIRTSLDWASKFQARVHPSFGDIDLPKYHTTQLALLPEEISRIYYYDLSKAKCRPQLKKTLERVKDMFVLGCNLGQRHSDLIRINHDNFADGKFRIVQQKTKNRAVVDLNKLSISRKITMEILEKYDYEAPYKADRSNYSRHIHQLMKLVFGDEMASPTIITGDLSVTKQVPKYSLISSHTARRSFASYNYITRRYSAREVMKATGHTEEKSFRAYICYDDEED